MNIEILIIITILTFVQSIFGVGILVFGTPIMLILNYDFYTILGILLPSSLIISLLQSKNFLSVIKTEKDSFFFAIFGISIGLAFNIVVINDFSLFILIFVLTLAASILKMMPKYKIFHFVILDRYRRTFHICNGIIHGLTNMGGVLLPIFSNLKSLSKNSVNYNAYFYSIYVISQLIWLIIFEKIEYIFNGLIYTPLAFIVYFILGRKIFRNIDNKTYNNLIVIFFWSLTFSLLIKVINFSTKNL